MLKEYVFLIEVGDPRTPSCPSPLRWLRMHLCPCAHESLCLVISSDEDQGGLFMNEPMNFLPWNGGMHALERRKDVHSGVVCAHIEPPLVCPLA